jgi:hypothetical protein
MVGRSDHRSSPTYCGLGFIVAVGRAFSSWAE